MTEILTILLLLSCFLQKAQAQPDERGGVTRADTVIAGGKTYAIIIGISDYKLVPDLQYAHKDAQENNDVVRAQEILKETFHTDVRSILAEARLRSGGALHPLQFFREEKIREALTKERGTKNIATGL